MARIFISYRRSDSADMSRRLYDALVKRVGKKQVFRDVDTLLKGHDFRAGIERYIIECDVMLVLIGDEWLDIRDTDTGERRLNNPEDYVRIEVDMGLRHVQTVVPVLVNGATMPGETELPVRLSNLSFKNATQMRDSHFDEDFVELLEAMGFPSQTPSWRRPLFLTGIGLVAIVVFIAALIGLNVNIGGLRNQTPDTSTDVVEAVTTPEPSAIELPAPTLTSLSTDNSLEQVLGRAEAGVSSNQDWQTWYPGGFVHDFGDGVEMVLVPAGCFNMGSEDGNDDEQPVHQQCFQEPFWIDKYEVSNEHYVSTDCTGSEPDQPSICVTWYQAVEHCASRNARLPTEAEWEYAARGVDNLVYPWGNEFVADNVVYSENSNNETAPVNSRAGGVSWVGAYDMSGNVWEWVSTIYDDYDYTGEFPYPYASDDGREDMERTDVYRVLRGGSFNSGTFFMRSAFRFRSSPGDVDGGFGFRCARSYD